MIKTSVTILTQPLGHNYGGLLQAYALQAYLKKLGCEVETLDRRTLKLRRLPGKSHLIHLARFMLGRIKSIPISKNQTWVLEELAHFRDRRIAMSPRITSERELREYYRDRKFDAFVVGSDQVWRPRYSPNILNFYLDFLDDINSAAKRMAYAASFGVDTWEYPDKLTEESRELAQKFQAVSVRERSAVELCKDKLGISAQWVVDPTLLLEPADYKELFGESNENSNADCVLLYALDPENKKSRVAHAVSSLLGYEVFSINPELSITQVRADEFDKCKFPSVERWLQAFHDARFIVTDSFHGTVLAILFNKPFIAIGNTKRGMARFESLLHQFGLMGRLVEPASGVSLELVSNEIDWSVVNNKRRILSVKSQEFLKANLSCN